MANSREKRERYSTFGSAVRSKFTSKWEVVLVFVIVAAGVVITTIAAIKAKERPDANQKDESIEKTEINTNNVNLNTKRIELTTKLNELQSQTNQSPDPNQSLTELSADKSQTNADFINNQNIRPPGANLHEDDYEALSVREEPKFHSSNLEPITSESNERRIETIHNTHDGLPGYPGPREASISELFKNKAELTADGAGFLIDENLKSNAPLVVNPNVQNVQVQKVVHNPQIPSNPRSPMAESNEKLTKQANEQIEKYEEKPESDGDGEGEPGSGPGADGDEHEANVYESEYSQENPMNQNQEMHHRKVQEMQTIPLINLNHNRNSQNDRRPQFIFQNADYNQHLPLFEHIKPVNGLPLAISIPRRIPFTHHHSNQMATPRSPNVAAGANINRKPYPAMHPIFLSQFSADTQLQRRKRSMNAVNEPKKNETNNQTNIDHTPENLYTASSSDYFKFNGDKSNEKSLFNFNVYPNKDRRKSGSSRSTRKQNSYSYFPTAASNTHQYGILGSGNFEIIRGGTFNNDEIASSDNNYIREQSNRYQSTDDYDDAANDEITKYPAPYSDEEDFFSNNPVLGFQGYDNFQAASADKSRHSNEDRGHSLENSSQPSQQVPVYMDQDLMATS